jgi:hypothetical protein
MATSPIYGWLEPDNTDLVKNGALAIRTLGNAIDTTMATMTPKSIVDAKGDLIAASAADTPARLAVGNNGETLVADSSTSTGLRWTPATVMANPVINGGMDIWQRGTSFTSFGTTSSFTADRYYAYRGSLASTITVSRQSSGLTGIQYSARIQRNSGDTSTSGINFIQDIESTNSIPFAGKTVTFSFYAKAGANYSAASSALTFALVSGTGTDQRIASGYTGSSTLINTTATLTTSWQRFTATATVGTTATQLGFYFEFSPVGTAGANDWYEVTGIQIDNNSVALPFRRAGGTIQGELAACQRYYYLHASGTSKAVGNGAYYSASEVDTIIQFPVTMRTAPTIDQTTGTDYYNFYRNGAADGFNSFTISYASTTATNLFNASQVSGTAGQAGQIATNNASAYLGFTAEL